MGNDDTQAALAFHAATKYRVSTDASGQAEYLMGTPPTLEDPIWQQDWSIEPRAYKVYSDLAPLALPTQLATSTLSALDVLARTGAEPRADAAVPDLAALARLARLSNGLLNRRLTTQRGRVVEFRTAGGTGARYHLELYFVCAELPDLAAGVYHYAADDHALRQLRTGDLRGVLVEASGDAPGLAQAPVIMVMTSTFWRNAWRYKARAYRHTFWDAGTSLANFLGVAASLDLPTTTARAGLRRRHRERAARGRRRDRSRRGPVHGGCRCQPCGADSRRARDCASIQPVSSAEVTFAEIPRMHAASSLASGAQAAPGAVVPCAAPQHHQPRHPSPSAPWRPKPSRPY